MNPASQGSLGQLMRQPGYWRWSLAAQLLRLPTLMAAMGYVLVSTDITGRPGLGGLLVGVMLVVVECSAPFTAKVVDRLGVAKWAPRLLLGSAAGRLILAGAFAVGGPTWLLILIVAVFAVIGSGAGGLVRVRLGEIVPGSMLGRALAFDSAVVELVIISAPFVVTAAALAGGLGPLFAMSACTTIGALLFWDGHGGSVRKHDGAAGEGGTAGQTGQAGEPQGTDAPARKRSASLWRSRRYVFWVLVAAAFGHLLGTAETGALPLAKSLHDSTLMASALIGALGGASALTGLLYAWLSGKGQRHFYDRACLLLAVMAAAVLVIAFAGRYDFAAAGFVLLGLCTAPINAIRSHAVGYVIPQDRQVEGFTIVETANGIGYAFAGFLLAILPLRAMLAAGAVTVAVVLAIAPILLRSVKASEPAEEKQPIRL